MQLPPRVEHLPHTSREETLPLVRGLTRLHEAVALIDDEGRLVWTSDALASACGRDAHSLRGRSWLELLARPAEGEALVERLCAEGRLLNEPVALGGPQDRELTATLSAARLGAPGQEAEGIVAIVRLSTDPVRAPRPAAAESLAVLEGAPDGVLVVDGSRFVTWANSALSEMTGWSIEELLDRPLALFLRAQSDLDRIAEALSPGGPVRSQDVEIRRRDGSTLSASVSVAVLRGPGGAPTGAVAYVRDVSEPRRFEEHLARKNAELEHYVDAVSHDLRSPLVSLLGFSRLLEEDYGERLDEKGRHFLKRIHEAGRTMEGLIQDLLELSRIGKTGPSCCWVDPREVLLQLQAELKPRLDTADVALSLPDDPPLVRCDRTRLYQLFSNLVGNALDHMGETDSPRIEVSLGANGAGHHGCVRDNGRGIDPSHHARIFEVFQSLGPRRGGRRGTGVGLAIVKKIVETQGGRIWVESVPGRGAAFHFTLPTG